MGRSRRRNPFRGLVDYMSEMNRMRESVEGGMGQEERHRTHVTAWVPTTDIFASGSDLVIRCELSGVKREDVEITLSGEALIISGERYGGLEEEEAVFYARERSYGTFRRSMTLPEGVEDEDISATFENGLLEITVKGAAHHPAPKQIQITDSPA